MSLSTYARGPKGWRRCRAILTLPAGLAGGSGTALLLCDLPSGHDGPHHEEGAVHTGGPLYHYDIRWQKKRTGRVKFLPLWNRSRGR